MSFRVLCVPRRASSVSTAYGVSLSFVPFPLSLRLFIFVLWLPVLVGSATKASSGAKSLTRSSDLRTYDSTCGHMFEQPVATTGTRARHLSSAPRCHVTSTSHPRSSPMSVCRTTRGPLLSPYSCSAMDARALARCCCCAACNSSRALLAACCRAELGSDSTDGVTFGAEVEEPTNEEATTVPSSSASAAVSSPLALTPRVQTASAEADET